MTPLVAILAVAAFFFLVVPGIGAFGVRRRWRLFRSRMVEASLLPPATYAVLRAGASPGARYRFLGTLESIQGDHLAWLRGDGITVAADMTESDVFLLPGAESEPEETPPVRTRWERLGSLPEGSKVLVSGGLDTSGAHPVLRAHDGVPLFVLFYDGPERTLVRRSIWSGRQQNEYWNSVTPGALAAGTLGLIVMAYLLMRQPQLLGFARLALVLAASPVVPLLPPGVALFYAFRLSWRRGRRSRAYRDVLRLPLRYLPEERRCGELPTGEPYCETDVRADELEALVPAGVHLERAPIAVRAGRSPVCLLYGRPAPEGTVAPVDPLAEWVAVDGDPRELAPRCNSRARRFELVSATVFTVGMVANYLVLLVVLARLV